MGYYALHQGRQERTVCSLATPRTANIIRSSGKTKMLDVSMLYGNILVMHLQWTWPLERPGCGHGLMGCGGSAGGCKFWCSDCGDGGCCCCRCRIWSWSSAHDGSSVGWNSDPHKSHICVCCKYKNFAALKYKTTKTKQVQLGSKIFRQWHKFSYFSCLRKYIQDAII